MRYNTPRPTLTTTRHFRVHPGATLTPANIRPANGNENAGRSGAYVLNAALNPNAVTISNRHTGRGDGAGVFAQNSTVNTVNSTVTGDTNSLGYNAIGPKR